MEKLQCLLVTSAIFRCLGYNLSPSQASIFSDPGKESDGSYFGFSVGLQNGHCKRIKYEESLDDAWIGASMDVQGSQNGDILVCGPRSLDVYGVNNTYMPGICYVTNVTQAEGDAEKLRPLRFEGRSVMKYKTVELKKANMPNPILPNPSKTKGLELYSYLDLGGTGGQSPGGVLRGGAVRRRRQRRRLGRRLGRGAPLRPQGGLGPREALRAPEEGKFELRSAADSARGAPIGGLVRVRSRLPRRHRQRRHHGKGTLVHRRIPGEEVDPRLRGFGVSFSRGLDTDGNDCLGELVQFAPSRRQVAGHVTVDFSVSADFAVGAHLSGHVAVLRSRPVITFEATLTPNVSSIAFDATGFEVRTCVKFTGAHAPDLVAAFLTYAHVTLPPSCALLRVPQNCEAMGDDSLRCLMANPLAPGATRELRLELDVKGLRSGTPSSLEVAVRAESQGREQSPQDNHATLRLALVSQADAEHDGQGLFCTRDDRRRARVARLNESDALAEPRRIWSTSSEVQGLAVDCGSTDCVTVTCELHPPIANQSKAAVVFELFANLGELSAIIFAPCVSSPYEAHFSLCPSGAAQDTILFSTSARARIVAPSDVRQDNNNNNRPDEASVRTVFYGKVKGDPVDLVVVASSVAGGFLLLILLILGLYVLGFFKRKRPAEVYSALRQKNVST
ncbi:hypothetical protein C0J52_00628 [Blattella germanica]|nr:hypothetical protein C0J52_00628 [Blattella germanica]